MDQQTLHDTRINYRELGGLCYFSLALCAGAMVYLPNREQDTHATPSAILLACVLACIAAGATGWKCGPAYAKPQGTVPAAVWVPLLVLLISTLVAALSYWISSPMLHHFPLEPAGLSTLQQLPSIAMGYLGFSAPVWLLGLPICTGLLWRKAVGVRLGNEGRGG